MNMFGRARSVLLLGSCAVGAACARAPHPVTPVTPVRAIARAPLPPANPKLPPVPTVTGSLHITVVYPPQGATVTSRDSNFIFGSVGNGDAGLMIDGTLVPVWPNGAFMGWVANPPPDAPGYTLMVYTATDTVRTVYHVRTPQPHPPAPAHRDTVVPVHPPQVALLDDDSLDQAVDDTDRVIIGRPSPSGTYRWFLFPATTVQETGTFADMARVALDGGQQIWVARRDVKVQPPPAAMPMLPVTRAALVPQREWIDLTLSVAAPPAYVVDETERGLTLTLYNTTSDDSATLAGVSDPYLADAQVRHDGARTMYTFTFTHPVYGYLALYHDGVMTFRIRRPPVIDRAHPLRGMTIAVDPGHPPIGATGPTGLYEPVATLAVGLRVRALLEAAGATVVMTRTTPAPVALGDRPIIARRADADALVSIHLNALPDGMNPFRNNGTGTYYFHTHSKVFATLMQESLVPELGLKDLGTFRENLALVRPTWMPAVLVEGAFIIMPDQEAALRTPTYQDAYARGIVRGLEQFFTTLAQ